MENTWLIGRTWKPREGWSRPVLTVERQHHTITRYRVARTNESIIRTTGRHPARHMDHSFSRVHYPVPNPPHKPPREHAQARPVGWITEDLRRPWPRGDARTHSEPGS